MTPARSRPGWAPSSVETGRPPFTAEWHSTNQLGLSTGAISASNAPSFSQRSTSQSRTAARYRSLLLNGGCRSSSLSAIATSACSSSSSYSSTARPPPFLKLLSPFEAPSPSPRPRKVRRHCRSQDSRRRLPSEICSASVADFDNPPCASTSASLLPPRFLPLIFHESSGQPPFAAITTLCAFAGDLAPYNLAAI